MKSPNPASVNGRCIPWFVGFAGYLGMFFTLTFAAPTSNETIVLNLNGLDIRIDKTTGNIVGLEDADVGTFLQADGRAGGLLDVAYPIPAFSPLRLASGYSQGVVESDKQGATITWEALGASRKSFQNAEDKVTASVTIKAADDGRSVVLSCRIENHSSHSIPQVLFPDLRGLRPIEGVENTRLRLSKGVVAPFAVPLAPADTVPVYYDRGWATYADTEYYSLHALRWLDFGGFRGGLSMFHKVWGLEHGTSCIRTVRLESDPTSLRLFWDHPAEIGPGMVWESGEFWLTPHVGGWAKGIEVFRNWVQEVNPSRVLPPHIRDTIGFQTIWMAQDPEPDPARAAFRYSDLLRVAVDAKAHGIEEVVPWTWNWSFRLPTSTRPVLGTEEEFLEAIKAARAIGVHISPFFSVHNALAGATKRYGVDVGVGRMANWTFHPEFVPQFQPTYAFDYNAAFVDSDNALWQQDVFKELSKWIEKGASSFVWDQYKPRTEKDRPSGMIQLTRQIRALARAKDPDATFAGESAISTNLEAESEVLDYTWDWKNYWDAGPIINVLRTPRLNANVESSTLVVKKAFADGLFLNVMPHRLDQPNGTALISENPPLSNALKQVAALRRQFLSYFVKGVFLGDSILSSPSTDFVHAHQLPGRVLIFVVNDSKESKTVSFLSDLGVWLPAASSYTVKAYAETGTLTKPPITSGRHAAFTTGLLAPAELAIFEVESQ